MSSKKISIYKKKQLPKPSPVFDTYWKFATERQSIFFKRILPNNEPLTSDPILLKHKFTNAFRASDRVSQYLIKNIIYTGSQDIDELLFRIILFKTFNKIETWELLNYELGEISYKTYSFKKYNKILSEALLANESIYSGAYIMTSGRSIFGFERKHQNHLKMIEQMMKEKLADQINKVTSLEKLYNLLKTYPTIGSFLAYQYAIDINYSNLTTFSEMDFVMPGPGALDGIKKCFYDMGDYSESDIIKYMTERQEIEFKRLGLNFQNLWGRSLQLIDCQNLFCEVGKYARVAHPDVLGISDRKRIKQLFNLNNSPIEYFYPPKWNINNKIKQSHEQREKRVYQSF